MIRPTSPVMRRTVAGLTLSAAALVGIVLHEGYTDRAVIPVKGDVPTIGFGTTTGVKLGDTTTPPKALARALTDVQQFEGALKQCVTVPLAQHEYDALVSFSYNVGSRAFCQSTLVRKLNAEDYAGACAELLRWRFFQGKDCALPANAANAAEPRHWSLPVLLGAVIGMLVTFTSVGAGAIGVTVLLLVYPLLPLPRIIGADIAYAVPLTLVAGLGHASLGSVDWPLLAQLLAGSLPGIWLGSRLVTRTPERLIRSALSLLLAWAGFKLILI